MAKSKAKFAALVGGLSALMVGMSANAGSDEVEKCRVINWKPNTVYVVKASLHDGTHIILPENQRNQNPIVGDNDLWNAESSAQHIWIQPNNYGNKEGRSTTLSAVGYDTNDSYDFRVKRVPQGRNDVCVQVKRKGNMLDGMDLSGWVSPAAKQNQGYIEEINRLRRQLGNKQEEIRAAQNAALNEYRSHIYTGYKVDGDSDWLGDSVVSDVWDDGRFTFIRLNEDNKAVLTVTAEIEGEPEMVEYKYVRESKTYQINGIYEAMELAYGDTTIEVERVSSSTSGGY